MSERPGIILYFDTMEPILRFLPNDSLGVLVRSAIQYAQTGEVPDMGEDKTLCFAWETLRQKLDRDEEAYQIRCEKNRENAFKRWGKEEASPTANASECMQPHAMDAKRKGTPKGTITPKGTLAPAEALTPNQTPAGDGAGKGAGITGRGTSPPPPTLPSRGDPGLDEYERLRQDWFRR